MENCEQQAGDLQAENALLLKRSQKTSKLYTLSPQENFKNITAAVLAHKNTSTLVKTAILQKNRHYHLFSYPSDGLQIKAYLSLPDPMQTPLPLLILLRGGNRIFGLPHPGELSVQEGFACVATTYRGGVSEGEDEFGGEDVNDVKNLFEYLPILAEKFQVQFCPQKTYLIGASRGGMQLFLALERYPALQKKIKKAVSISGLLDLAFTIKEREDFRETMQKDFGLPSDDKAQAWIDKRQPIKMINAIAKELPLLIAQGTKDNRVSLQQGYEILTALQQVGHRQVTYWEFAEGNHVLMNVHDFIPRLIQWLEA